MRGMGTATHLYSIIKKFGLHTLKKYTTLWSLLSVCNFWIFFRKDIGKRFGVRIGYTWKGYITISFAEGFSLLFSQNPGLPDLYALFGYIKYYTPKSGDIVVDAGGYHGLCALYFSKLVGDTGRVIVFEPDSKNMDVLRKNIAINKLHNIILVQKGLRSHETQLSFVQTGEMFSMLGEKSDRSPDAKANTIDVVNPLEECKKLGYPHVDFIKMDIEGAEIEVIQGLLSSLPSCKSSFAIASYHMVPDEQYTTSIVLETLFTQVGYFVETSRPEHTTTFARKK